MKMVYNHKQLQLENMVEAVQEMAMTDLLQKDDLSFFITTYKQGNTQLLIVHAQKAFPSQGWRLTYPDGMELFLLESKKSLLNLYLRMGSFVSLRSHIPDNSIPLSSLGDSRLLFKTSRQHDPLILGLQCLKFSRCHQIIRHILAKLSIMSS